MNSTNLTILLVGLLLQGATTITSEDRRTAITLPAGWVQTDDLNDAAGLQARNEATGAYVIVVAEPRGDLFGWNLTRHSMGTIGDLVENVISPQVSGPNKVTLSGFQGVQYEVKGASAEGFNVGYLHTTLETPNQYLQILMWSGQSQFERNKTAFDVILKSIRESS